MVSLFYVRRYPAGREFKRDQPVPNDTPTPGVTNPSDLPLADGVPASSNDPGPTPTDEPNPTPTDDSGATPTDVLPQPTVVTDPSPWFNDPPPTPDSAFVPDQQPTNRDQQPPLGPPPTSTPDSCTPEPAPPSSSPQSTATDCFASSLTLNYPQPTPDLLTSSTVTPTPTAVLTEGGALSAGSSSNRKYIIGGAVGAGAFLLTLLALLLFCCRKRRAKGDLEYSSDAHSEGQHGHGQFVCCNHGTCNRNNGQPHMEQKTPLKPFALRSDPATLIPREGRQEHAVSLTRRDSTETQKSAGSDSSTATAYSSDSEGSQRGRRRSRKRPPPLKLTSLVTPVINVPQHNPRNRVNRLSLSSPHGVPAIIVEPPQSETPDRMRRR